MTQMTPLEPVNATLLTLKTMNNAILVTQIVQSARVLRPTVQLALALLYLTPTSVSALKELIWTLGVV